VDSEILTTAQTRLTTEYSVQSGGVKQITPELIALLLEVAVEAVMWCVKNHPFRPTPQPKDFMERAKEGGPLVRFAMRRVLYRLGESQRSDKDQIIRSVLNAGSSCTEPEMAQFMQEAQRHA